MRRTSRCPTIPITDDATRKDSIPMSRNRWSAETESVAWSEDNTRWPVERRLNGNASCLDISDLTNEDDIGILSQDGTKPGCEGQSRLLVRLDLIDARKDVLDRILNRHHVAAGIADLSERGVQRRRLAASRGTGAQHHAKRGPDEVRVRLGRSRPGMPRSARRITERVRSRSRITHFSPQIVASVATRTSTSRPSISVRSWPS